MDTALVLSKRQEGFPTLRFPFLERSASLSGKRFEGLRSLLAELFPPLGEVGIIPQDRGSAAVPHPGTQLSCAGSGGDGAPKSPRWEQSQVTHPLGSMPS